MSDKAVLILCIVIAAVILAVSILLSVFNRRNLKLIVRILGAGVFLMMVVLIYPSYSIQGETFALGLALVQSMCAMLLNADAGAILAAFNGYQLGFIGFYKSVILALLIIAPLFTVGITLSFFSDKFTRMLYRIRCAFSASFLFSEINERTLCIAEDIASKNKKAVIVFAVKTDKDKIDARALGRIKGIGTVINDDIVNIAHSLKHERNYYMFSADGNANLDAGLRLYNKYNGKQTDKVNMWLYTDDEISEVIFDHLYETFNVRLVNERSLIARQLVTAHPLYNAVEDGRLSVLVVGCGNVGLEILRWTTMCSCLGDKVETQINVIGIDADRAKAVFQKTSPELATKRNINFIGADVNTFEFKERLLKIRPTYIAISLGNENRNLEAALYIRRTYGIKDGFPQIYALVDHRSIEEYIIPNLCVTDWEYDKKDGNYKRNDVVPFDIRPFGSYEDTHCNLRIGASYLDCLAVAHNAAYCNIFELDEKYTPAVLTDLYNQVIFFKNYSDAFAVSVSYKLHLMGLELVDDGKGDLSMLEARLPQNLKLLREHENMRHEAFMRAGGWTDMLLSEVEGGSVGNKLKKLNARLDNTNIEELAKKTGRDFDKEDEDALKKLPAIIRLANALYGKNYSVREK